jgi:hypothetical protein
VPLTVIVDVVAGARRRRVLIIFPADCSSCWFRISRVSAVDEPTGVNRLRPATCSCSLGRLPSPFGSSQRRQPLPLLKVNTHNSQYTCCCSICQDPIFYEFDPKEILELILDVNHAYLHSNDNEKTITAIIMYKIGLSNSSLIIS